MKIKGWYRRGEDFNIFFVCDTLFIQDGKLVLHNCYLYENMSGQPTVFHPDLRMAVESVSYLSTWPEQV